MTALGCCDRTCKDTDTGDSCDTDALDLECNSNTIRTQTHWNVFVAFSHCRLSLSCTMTVFQTETDGRKRTKKKKERTETNLNVRGLCQQHVAVRCGDVETMETVWRLGCCHVTLSGISRWCECVVRMCGIHGIHYLYTCVMTMEERVSGTREQTVVQLHLYIPRVTAVCYHYSTNCIALRLGKHRSLRGSTLRQTDRQTDS